MAKKVLMLLLGLMLLEGVSQPAWADDFAGVYGNGPVKFTLATGSPGELGLLKVLPKVKR